MAAKLLRIFGRVQGVNFRSSMQHEAQRLGISGWVRNRVDDTVEALVCGSPEKIEIMLEWARHGPRLSNVERIEEKEVLANEGDDFEVLPTE